MEESNGYSLNNPRQSFSIIKQQQNVNSNDDYSQKHSHTEDHSPRNKEKNEHSQSSEEDLKEETNQES